MEINISWVERSVRKQGTGGVVQGRRGWSVVRGMFGVIHDVSEEVGCVKQHNKVSAIGRTRKSENKAIRAGCLSRRSELSAVRTTDHDDHEAR